MTAWHAAGALALLAGTTAAQAQFAGNIALSTDDMFRGYSVSAGDPALNIGLSAELGHGIYGGVTAAAAFGGSPSPVFNGSNLYFGIARRLASGVSIDVGVVHRHYTQYATNDYADDFVEAYVGVSIQNIGARLFMSPNYGGPGAPAAYFEVNATPFNRNKWSVAGKHPVSTAGDGPIQVFRRLHRRPRASRAWSIAAVSMRFGSNVAPTQRRTSSCCSWVGSLAASRNSA